MLPLGLVLLVLGPAGAAADGGPVRSFGTGGAASFAPARFSSGAGVAMDAQGRILVGATLDDGSLLRTRAAVLRLLPDGSLDPSFGSGGVATIAPPAPYVTSRAEAIALDAQGRIVVAGEVDDDVPAVARLLADGTLDPAFASAGLLIAKGAYGGLPGGWKSVVVSGSAIVLAGAVDGAPPFGTSLGRIAVVARIADDGTARRVLRLRRVPAAADRGRHVRKHARHRDRSQRAHRARHLARDHRGLPGDVAAAVVRVTTAGALDGIVRQRRPGGARPAAGARAGGQRHGHGCDRRARRMDRAYGRHRERRQAEAGRSAGRDVRRLGRAGRTARRPRRASSIARAICWCRATTACARFGPDGRLDRTFRGAGIPPVAVGGTSTAAELRLARARLGRIAPPERHGCSRADRDRRRRSERHHRDRRRARRRELPDRRFEATHGDARLRRGVPPRRRRGARRSRRTRCPARPARDRAHRRQRAARPGTAAASRRSRAAGPRRG